MKLNILYLIGFLFLFWTCEPEADEISASKGNADFTKYIALGNSLTAGYADGALYKSGQENSYPNIIAGQLKLVGLGDFKQPLMTDEFGLSNIPGAGVKFVLGFKTDCLDVTSLSPVPETNPPTMANLAPVAGPFQNMGVPGAKVVHLLAPGYGNSALGPGNYNPYYARFATTPATSSILADALAQQPTFFSLWIGNNDVLGYAMAGGASGAITPGANFAGYYSAIVSQLLAITPKPKGVLANIPDIPSIPFFTTIPVKGLALSEAQATALNAAYHNGLLGINFSAGANFWVIQDTSAHATFQMRQIKATELITMYIPQDSLKCAGWGSTKPIPANYVLDEAEIAAIDVAVDSYNATIQSLADANGLALVDMNGIMNEIKANGLVIYPKQYTTAMVTGGLFSLDGVHMSKQGYAIVANYFIDAINGKYGSTIPKVDPNSYPGIVFP